MGLRGINYRMLYFFHGRVAAVLSHGLTKERAVPAKRSTVRRGGSPCSRAIPDDIPTGRPDVAARRKATTDAVEVLRRRYVEGRPEQQCALEEIRADSRVARMIRDLRTVAGLTQRQLAELVGTSASVICRLEDADYEGHSLGMLRRIATALGMTVEVRLVPGTQGIGPETPRKLCTRRKSTAAS